MSLLTFKHQTHHTICIYVEILTDISYTSLFICIVWFTNRGGGSKGTSQKYLILTIPNIANDYAFSEFSGIISTEGGFGCLIPPPPPSTFSP